MKRKLAILMIIFVLLTCLMFSYQIDTENHTMNMQLILNGINIATETFWLKKMDTKSLEVKAETLIDINYKGTVYTAKYLTTGKFNDLKVESYNATITATNGNFHYSLEKRKNGFEIFFKTPASSNKKFLNISDDLYLLDNNVMWNWFLVIKALEKSGKSKLKVVIPQLSSHPMVKIPVFDLEILDEYSEEGYKFYILSLVNSQVIVKLDENGRIIEILQGAFRVTQTR